MTLPPRSTSGRSTPFQLVLLAALALATSACGRRDGPQRQLVPVRGTVTIDGKPLEKGEVYFVTPVENSAQDGYFIDVCPVSSGGFSGRTVPGRRVVQVWSFVPAPGGPDPVTGEAPMPINVIPSAFSDSSKINVEIPKTGSDSLAFEIKSK